MASSSNALPSLEVQQRADRIKKQLQVHVFLCLFTAVTPSFPTQEHAKVKSQLAQAQSQLQKTAVEWRRERSKRVELVVSCCKRNQPVLLTKDTR